MRARVLVAMVQIATSPSMGSDAWAGDLAKRVVGTWKLVSTEQRMRDGTTRPSPLYGSNGIGYLIYTEAGRMCAVLMDPSRSSWKSEDEPTEAELRSAFEHFVAYCGRYEVNEAGGFVIHRVEMDVVPNSAGAERKRFISLKGNRLMLRPAEQVGKDVVEYTLTWERVDESPAR